MHKLLNKTNKMFLLNSKIISILKHMSKDEEDTLGNMSEDEQPRDDHQISKDKKGVQHTINMDVLNNKKLLAKQG